MSKKAKKKDNKDVKNISDELYKNYKIIKNFYWRGLLFTINLAFVICMAIVAYDAYLIKSNQLKVEANNINNAINEEFSVVVNSINMNGYLTLFEQYLKTTSASEEITSTLYYEDTVKTLNTMSLINENIENVFVVSFSNGSVLYSGISNNYKENFDFQSQPWYNYKEITKNNAYLSEEYEIEGYDGKMFGIARPIMDSMSDEPLGVLIFSFNKEYFESVFLDSIKQNKSETIIRIDNGKILYSTVDIEKEIDDEVFVDSYIVNNKNIMYGLDNDNLNWNVISYCGIDDILLNSLNQFLVVTAVFVLIRMVFNMFIKKLKIMKVIRNRKEIKKIIDLNSIQEEIIENAIEDIDVDDYEEMPIEEVLYSNIDMTRKDIKETFSADEIMADSTKEEYLEEKLEPVNDSNMNENIDENKVDENIYDDIEFYIDEEIEDNNLEDDEENNIENINISDTIEKMEEILEENKEL